ncbi:MAG TPA: tail fiber protein [Steroidobacteraceae bacterium]
MEDQFIGEIRMVGFSFAPTGWALCDGSLLPISQNQALFALLGTMFGGDGKTTFGLPDLRGRSPVGMGHGPNLTAITQGQMAGSESATILPGQMPMHTHAINVAGAATNNLDKPSNTNNVLGASGGGPGSATIWSTALTSPVALNPAQVGSAGSNQPLPIRNPFTGINFIIALTGIYPTRG